jgi:predicted CXXCH cytochrome family protein
MQAFFLNRPFIISATNLKIVICMSKSATPRYRSTKGSVISNYRRMEVILICLLSIFLPPSLQAYDFQGCKDCHNTILARGSSAPYLHPPFTEGECGECHAVPVAEDNPNGQNDLRKIDWLVKNGVIDTSHGFVLPGDKLGDTLVIDLYGISGTRTRHTIAMPSRIDLAEVDDSGSPPSISELQVLKVERHIFLSVTVGWQTDTLSYASVRFGDGNLTQISESGNRLARQHEVVLPDLKPDRTYRFTAVSRDLFGRSQVSEPLIFSTSEPLPTAQSENAGNLPAEGNEAGLTTSFQRFGDDFLIELTLEQPASVSIGSRGEPRCVPDDAFHAGLTCGVVSSIGACLGCHNAHLHPVNVSPTKPGIAIPPEFPTLSGGRISCTSCHNPHGSDYPYFVRKSGEHDLCVSCHQKLK